MKRGTVLIWGVNALTDQNKIQAGLSKSRIEEESPEGKRLKEKE